MKILITILKIHKVSKAIIKQLIKLIILIITLSRIKYFQKKEYQAQFIEKQKVILIFNPLPSYFSNTTLTINLNKNKVFSIQYKSLFMIQMKSIYSKKTYKQNQTNQVQIVLNIFQVFQNMQLLIQNLWKIQTPIFKK